ncbi:type III pantothenate kinase [Emticicia sp. BO119]|uniref:type III pantothenate kinase n=1 Tax=Emticicia sp. BO119 TaxID=2757768 RepID=UPI0015F052C9|nr:type III pantothenate kinase [Emticicia sp. BO119]MBA4852107.1 type III pantothenate kinase [Emticicia sp. BO119]
MFGVVDIGNTFAKIGLFEGDELVEVSTGLEIEALDDFLSLKKVKKALISSVTKNQQELEAIFEQVTFDKLILTPSTTLPIEKDYETPETLGSDRVAAAVGANFLYPECNCLIIDMGTAIKYDYVSIENKYVPTDGEKRKGVFCGGIISPGMRIRFESLHTFTKRLPLVSADGIPHLIGKNTITCIQSGVVNGIIAEVNGMIENYSKLGKCQVILCGGDASFFESQIKKPNFARSFEIGLTENPPIDDTKIELIPNLVLIGLNRILIYNVEKLTTP